MATDLALPRQASEAHKVQSSMNLIGVGGSEPEDLYRAGDGSFEFQRTVSRLMEMQSAEYMAEGHGEAG